MEVAKWNSGSATAHIKDSSLFYFLLSDTAPEKNTLKRKFDLHVSVYFYNGNYINSLL